MENKVVLITGTSSGFGYLTVKSTAKMGLTVYAGMRNIEGKNKPKADELTEFAKMNNLKINPVEMDVTDEKSVDDAVKSIMSTERTIDILINNAGVSCGGWTEAFTAEQFYKVLDVNLMGVHRVNRTVLPFMRKQNSGLIIYISSICGRMIIPFMGPYNASKFAVEGLAESYSCELSGFGIKSVIIEPSVFQTNVGKNMLYSDDIERLNTFEDKLNEPEEFFNGFF